MDINSHYDDKLAALQRRQATLLKRRNCVDEGRYNGIVDFFTDPVVTPAHVPLDWRYDLNVETNPFLMERLGINATFNAGAIEWEGSILVMCRVEGMDRKSFFAIAESESGVDGFRFRKSPVVIPETDDPDTNVYDMRLVRHEDGWIYGIFCTERKDPSAPASDTSSAVAQCGIVRTGNLKDWERFPDLQTPSPQQRNCVLHPEFIDGKYAWYTRPQDGFIEAGNGGGIGFGYSESIYPAIIQEEHILDDRVYHSVKESKNGQGPAPIKTDKGWLHLAHGVRACAAGLRYVLYLLVTDLTDPSKVIAAPGGYFIAPQGEERVGDVSNVVFANGWIQRESGEVLIYYASSDTRLHVARSTVDRLLDYCFNTPPDSLRSAEAVNQRIALIRANNLRE